MKQYLALLLTVLLFSCSGEKMETVIIDNKKLQSTCVKSLTDVIVHDIFPPPVASRIYAYTNLAYYEAVRFSDSGATSIAAGLHGFDAIPVPEKSKQYNYYLAAVRSFYKTGSALIFSKDSLRLAENKLLEGFEQTLGKTVYNNSIELGDSIATIILKRAAGDQYKETRGMPRYSAFKETGIWEQTPPDYADATEPHWDKIKPFLLDSPGQFRPAPPPPYSLDKNSQYYRELMELYNTSKTLTPGQDSIARYWDDNPFVTQHEGHLMFANKKTTPGGHWEGITAIISAQTNSDAIQTARAYALMSLAIHDSFIACWHEKFRSRTVRPITVIQNNIEAEWTPILQTPSFPEYTSGHSTISAAAATVLTDIFGENISFHDTTELEYLGLERSFSSIMQAANEVSISRLYGGIHYRSALDNGFKQGTEIGRLYMERFKYEALSLV